MKYKILKLAFLVWVALWMWFIARELFIKGGIDSYRALFGRPLEEKHSYITGSRLYEFLKFCKAAMPEGSNYKIAGLDASSIEKRRAVYYLYPDIDRDEADYILVYDCPDAAYKGYDIMTRLDDSRYIMRKKNGV